MARALVLGNGSTNVCLDDHGYVRDIYYHYVGLENHVSGLKHRIGVRVNGVFSFIDDGSWKINISYKPETMVGYLLCKNEKLQVSIVMEDAVYNETNVFLREVDIYNESDEYKNIEIFFHQIFAISESKKRNTGFYDPTHNTIVHYKGRRVFIINGRTDDDHGFDDYSVGAYGYEGKEGTYKDAEDGILSKNAVEHGSVDSVIRFSVGCEPKEKRRVHYFINIGKSLEEGYALNDMTLAKTPGGMIHSTEKYWNAWLNKRDFDTDVLSKEQKKLFDVSLFVLRAHTDNVGSIIASADSEMIEYGKDDYSYMWPRDASFIVNTLDMAGYHEATEPFFLFCNEVLHPDGYLHHRYRPDRSLGSTWHSTVDQRQWLKDRILQLPIQEDESASVLIALWKHYVYTKDVELIESLYKPMIEPIANFLVNFRHKDTGLPLPSYDLWEEKIGISTYTCACTYGGLVAAANFSELLGKRNHMRKYKNNAEEIKDACIKYLYSEKLRSFVRLAKFNDDGQLIHDETVDSSSLFGLWYFGMLELDNELLLNTKAAVDKRLKNSGKVGGYIRYENDNYFRSTDISNPWFITTLWQAQMILAKEKITSKDLEQVNDILDWVVKYRYKSGVLAEQLNPYTGESLSATPLVWSHSVYIETVLTYIKRKKELNK